MADAVTTMVESTQDEIFLNADFDLLISKICNELKKRDKHKNGLILHNVFIEVMELFKIEYGTNVMDYLMKNCHVTEDGYVNYKNLLLLHDPSKNITNNSTNMSESINSPFIALQDHYDESLDTNSNAQMKNETIRKLYAQWDKCLLNNGEFIEKLNNANIEVTPEFRRAISLYGPSRSLKFVDVMKSLYINNKADRKCRSDYFNTQKEPCKKSSFDLVYNDINNNFQNPQRNPIAWEENNELEVKNLFENIKTIATYYSEQTVNDTDTENNIFNNNNNNNNNNIFNNNNNNIFNNNNNTNDTNDIKSEQKKHVSKEFINLTIKNLVKLYIGNNLTEYTLRSCLRKLNIPISTELNSLIRQHESNNTGKFRDFITIIYRGLAREGRVDSLRPFDETNSFTQV